MSDKNKLKLNSIKLKSQKGSTAGSTKTPNKEAVGEVGSSLSKSKINDDILTRMAIEEIFKETSKASVRAEQVGPSGWRPCPKTNKRFLNTTIKCVISHNNRQQGRPRSSSDNEKRKFKQFKPPKFGRRDHHFSKPVASNNKASSDKER